MRGGKNDFEHYLFPNIKVCASSLRWSDKGTWAVSNTLHRLRQCLPLGARYLVALQPKQGDRAGRLNEGLFIYSGCCSAKHQSNRQHFPKASLIHKICQMISERASSAALMHQSKGKAMWRRQNRGLCVLTKEKREHARPAEYIKLIFTLYVCPQVTLLKQLFIKLWMLCSVFHFK